MKMIKLAQPATVNDELRHPIEGALRVTDAEATRLKNANLLDGDPEDAEGDDGGEDVEDLDKMSVADLHILVTKEGVPLHDATKKADIVAAIRKHRDEKAG